MSCPSDAHTPSTTPAAEVPFTPPPSTPPLPARVVHIDPDNDDRFLARDRLEEREEAYLDRMYGD